MPENNRRLKVGFREHSHQQTWFYPSRSRRGSAPHRSNQARMPARPRPLVGTRRISLPQPAVPARPQFAAAYPRGWRGSAASTTGASQAAGSAATRVSRRRGARFAVGINRDVQAMSPIGLARLAEPQSITTGPREVNCGKVKARALSKSAFLAACELNEVQYAMCRASAAREFGSALTLHRLPATLRSRLGRRHRRPSDPHPSYRNSGWTPGRALRWNSFVCLNDLPGFPQVVNGQETGKKPTTQSMRSADVIATMMGLSITRPSLGRSPLAVLQNGDPCL